MNYGSTGLIFKYIITSQVQLHGKQYSLMARTILIMEQQVPIWHKGIFIMASSLQFIKSTSGTGVGSLSVTDCFNSTI